MLTFKEKFVYLLKNKNLKSLRILSDAISIKPNDLLFIMAFLKKYNNLIITATAVDQPFKINRFALHYILSDYTIAQRFYVDTNVSTFAQSISTIFSSAIWLEREIYDLFGVYFTSNTRTGHEDLRRLLTDYHFKGHPLRKDFTLIGYNEKLYSHLTKTIKDKSNLFF